MIYGFLFFIFFSDLARLIPSSAYSAPRRPIRGCGRTAAWRHPSIDTGVTILRVILIPVFGCQWRARLREKHALATRVTCARRRPQVNTSLTAARSTLSSQCGICRSVLHGDFCCRCQKKTSFSFVMYCWNIHETVPTGAFVLHWHFLLDSLWTDKIWRKACMTVGTLSLNPDSHCPLTSSRSKTCLK